MNRSSTERLPVALGLSAVGALVAVIAGLPEAALFAAPWLVLVVLGLAAQRNPEVHVSVRVMADRIFVGDEVEVVATVVSTTDGLVKLVAEPVQTFWSPQLAADERRATHKVDHVVAGEPREITTRLRSLEWGAHDLGQTSVELRPPYGLFRLTGRTTRSAIVRVHPTPTQLNELLSPWMVRRVSGTHASNVSARGIEYADIRQFGPGDSVRDINWRASARSADLWVSQRHPDRATDVVLLVDSFIESGHDVRRVFGLAVEAAVALAESHLGATDRVGLIEFGGLVRWVTPAAGRVQLQRLTDALLATGLYATAAEKQLPIMAPRALPPRSFVVALTPLLDQRFVDALFAARSRGHDVAVIECATVSQDDDRTGPLAADVSMALWQAERSMLKDLMAEQGITTATWHDGEHLDIALGELIRRRRRAVRVRGR